MKAPTLGLLNEYNIVFELHRRSPQERESKTTIPPIPIDHRRCTLNMTYYMIPVELETENFRSFLLLLEETNRDSAATELSLIETLNSSSSSIRAREAHNTNTSRATLRILENIRESHLTVLAAHILKIAPDDGPRETGNEDRATGLALALATTAGTRLSIILDNEVTTIEDLTVENLNSLGSILNSGKLNDGDTTGATVRLGNVDMVDLTHMLTDEILEVMPRGAEVEVGDVYRVGGLHNNRLFRHSCSKKYEMQIPA